MLNLFIAVTALLLPTPSHARISKDQYTDPATGFSISKPADWEFVQAPKAHGLKLKDESVMNAVNKTVVTFTKNLSKDFFGVKPTVGVERKDLPAKTSPVDWLTEEVKRQADQNKYYRQYYGQAAVDFLKRMQPVTFSAKASVGPLNKIS